MRTFALASQSDCPTMRCVLNITTTETDGRNSKIGTGSIEFPFGFWLGGDIDAETKARQVASSSFMPDSGELAWGDFAFNTAPTSTPTT
jgi:hypothetical protein